MSKSDQDSVEVLKEMKEYFSDMTAYTPEVEALTKAIAALENQPRMIEALDSWRKEVEKRYYAARGTNRDSIELRLDVIERALEKITKIAGGEV
jgi:hypothetical protein